MPAACAEHAVKISVSIPAHVWRMAKAISHPDAGASAIVQEALIAYVLAGGTKQDT